MAVMGQQMKALDSSMKANHCAPTDLTPRLQTLRLVANDIEPAFAGHARRAAVRPLRQRPARRRGCRAAGPAGQLRGRQAALTSLGKACDSCHRDFRTESAPMSICSRYLAAATCELAHI